MKRRIRTIIVIVFIAQVISTILAITGAFVVVAESSNFLKYSLKAEEDILRHESVITKSFSTRTFGTSISHLSHGYFVSDSLDGNLNMKIIEQYVPPDDFENYLIKKDSLLPVWRLPKSNSCLFRYEEKGEGYSIRRVLKLIRFASLMIGPFFILLYINRFLNKKRKEYAQE